METRSLVARLETVYSPGHNSASFCTRPFASSRLCTSSTKCRVPSVRNLKIEKSRRIQLHTMGTTGETVKQLSHQFDLLGSRRGSARATFYRFRWEGRLWDRTKEMTGPKKRV